MKYGYSFDSAYLIKDHEKVYDTIINNKEYYTFIEYCIDDINFNEEYLNSNLVGHRIDANGNRLPNQNTAGQPTQTNPAQPAQTTPGQPAQTNPGQPAQTNPAQNQQGGGQQGNPGYIDVNNRHRYRYRMRGGLTNAGAAISRVDTVLGSSSTWKNVWEVIKKPLGITVLRKRVLIKNLFNLMLLHICIIFLE